MVVVPAGTFRMGCLQDQDCARDELPVREVTISERFALSKHEVTFENWDACVDGGGCNGYLPDDEGWGRGKRPVIHVNWHDAQAYVAWLSGSTGETYRLPSEADWEYAARAGTETQYDWGDEIGRNRANCRDNGCADSHANTAPAGSFAANPWGLYDMHGNVYEWVQDCWNGSSYRGAPSDGSAWLDGDCASRMVRGGAWSSGPSSLRAANRTRESAERRQNTVGFRVARTLPAVGLGVVALFPAAAESAPQGFVRVINHSEEGGEVQIDAFDDSGRSYGPVTLSIDAGATVHFNSDDLESGNADKGLSGGVGSGAGDWRLDLSSALDIEILSYIRTPDGFLTAMRETVPAIAGRHRVPIFNPGRNRNQVSRLRLVNPTGEDAEVSITGRDDAGQTGGGEVSLSLPAGESRTIFPEQLESGSGDLDGALGAGEGKWRLTVVPSAPILVMSLLESPTGHLTNLSTSPDSADDGEHSLPLFPSKSSVGRQGFVRVVNRGDQRRDVRIYAVDDDGNRYGPISLTVEPDAAVNFNSRDLEDGNAEKGLTGSTGPGAGDWRLELTSDLDIEVLVYVRTDDGFLTAIHDIAPRQANHHRIAVFNPGGNRKQVSLLRLVNSGSAEARTSIRGIDDAGKAGGPVEVAIPAGEARTYAAWELESGGGELHGALGDGTGKWQLEVASEQPIVAMSLLESPTGHLTNLSAAEFRRTRLATALDVFTDLISGPVVQSLCVSCHVAGGEASDTRLLFVPDSQADHENLNREAFEDFLIDVEDGGNLMLAKTRGDAGHGGGIQAAADSAEYANLARFLGLVIEESTASFDSITYEGSATLGNGERMAAGDLVIEVPERTLVDDITIEVDETSLPAPLPRGLRQMADPVEIAISAADQDSLNGPLIVTLMYPEDVDDDGDPMVMHYEPNSRQWLPATLYRHDRKNRTVEFGSRAFSTFALVNARSDLPGERNTGFDPARHGFGITNRGYDYHTPGGNCVGMSAYAIYHFLYEKIDLFGRWDDGIQKIVGTLAQLSQPAWGLNYWSRVFSDRLSNIKRELQHAPVILILSRWKALDFATHAVVAYGYEGDELLIYDPNYPGSSWKTSERGQEFRPCSRNSNNEETCEHYSVSGFVHLFSTGSRVDFEGLTSDANAGFGDSALLTVDVQDGQEVSGRKLDFRGSVSGRLDDDQVDVSVAFGDVQAVTKDSDGAFHGSVEGIRLGENTLVFLAGIRQDIGLAGRELQFWKRNYWEIGSAALIRNVVGSFEAAALQINLQWPLPTDLDLYVQDPTGEVMFWGNRETASGFEFAGDNRRIGDDERRETETAALLNTDTVADGTYRLFVHQYDDYGYNEPLYFTVRLTVNEGTLSGGTSSRSFRIEKGRQGIGSATTVDELLSDGLIEIARVNLSTSDVCWLGSDGTFDFCATSANLEPVAPLNGDQTVVKPSSGWVPDWVSSPDLEISIDSQSLPGSNCTVENPWKACYHKSNAARGDLVEVRVTMPREPSGNWHGAWCVKSTPEGLCRGQHDSTDRIEKRFAENATLSFATNAPQDATSFWIVGEIRECLKDLCYWPTDYTEVEFHHIEVGLQGRSVGSRAEMMYWLDAGLVRRSGPDGSSAETIIDFGRDVGNDLAIDPDGGKAYIVDAISGTVRRANLDGSSVETIVSGLRRPDGIALDGKGKMYFAAEGMYRANLDGSDRETLISSLPWPQDIALDLANSMIYWVDHSSDRVHRARLDGSGVETLVTSGLRAPEGIALDFGEKKMYWTDSDRGRIQRSNLDGSEVEDVITGLSSPYSVAIDARERLLYWTELGADRIRRSRMDGTDVELLVEGVERGGPTGLALVGSQ